MPKARGLIVAALLTTACATGPVGPGPRTSRLPVIELLAPERWPEIEDDLEPASFLKAGSQSVSYLKSKGDAYYDIGPMRVGTQRLIETIEELGAIVQPGPGKEELSRLLKEGFELYRVNRSTDPDSAHFSSYYQPILDASPMRTEEFQFPIYKAPADMIELQLGRFDDTLKGKTLIARRDEKGDLVPYFDRRDIDVRNVLQGRDLEIAWLKTGFDRLNLHIQGSGILRYPDGREDLARFAATSAHPYKSVGMAVVGAGAMTRAEITSEKLRLYLQEHPEGEAWLLSQNPRYTFFSLEPLTEDGEPSGSMGRPLTAGRSIAIDPKFVPLGAVAFVSLPMIHSDQNGKWLGKYPARRFVHCQDTGGAIKGPGRVDLYMGHGPQASATAHNIWEKGSLFVLLKKLPARTR